MENPSGPIKDNNPRRKAESCWQREKVGLKKNLTTSDKYFRGRGSAERPSGREPGSAVETVRSSNQCSCVGGRERKRRRGEGKVDATSLAMRKENRGFGRGEGARGRQLVLSNDLPGFQPGDTPDQGPVECQVSRIKVIESSS